MKPYKYVCKFTLDNNEYVMFMDQNNKRFFLKHTDFSYNYLTDEELFNVVSALYHSEDVYDAERGKAHKIVPKIIIGGVTVQLIPSILATSLMFYNKIKYNEAKRNYNNSLETVNVDSPTIYNNNISEEYMNKYLSTAELYNINGNEIDTYLKSDLIHYTYVYDMDYINLIYDDDMEVTKDSLEEVLLGNTDIPDNYKELFREYFNQLFLNYDGIELRPFYENLKTLKIVECNKHELLLHTLSEDSYACYVRSENVIYVPENTVYEKGTWEYQVLFHEISHCLRTRMAVEDGTKIIVQCEGMNFFNLVTAESLNSLFAVSLLGYEEDDIAYQLQSNYNRIMIDCMDNYDLSDYVNHSISYYINKLDEHNNEVGVAPVIMELMQMQYDDYHNDKITIEQEEFYQLYDYIAKMYFDKYITEDMSYDEMKSVVDELVSKVTFDVSDEYHIDTNHFYEYFESYTSEKGYSKVRS